VPVNIGLAQLSDHFLLSTVVLYALGMLAFAGDFAYGRASRRTPAGAGAAAEGAAAMADPARVAVPAGVAASATLAADPAAPGDMDPAPPGGALPGSGAGGTATGPAEAAAGPAGAVAASRWRAGGAPAGPWVRVALVFTTLGLLSQMAGILTRGLAEHRVPWGNMYEFVTAITCAAVIAFLLLCIRFRIYSLGLFVLAPIVLGLGLCATVLYTAAGPLVPALHSYWIWIHVTAMTLAIGSFIVAAVLTTMYLVADRYTGRRGTATGTGFGAILQRLPAADALDRLSYRTVVFAFPIWTFGVIAGAIWADQAWGRYWGWDPKETWAFISWVVYAGYLHARATAGWRGHKAAYIQLVGFATLLFNLVGVNLWITGLHSYAGIN
jgi:cytochrome c-type biogenesis protein CcsB